jgi:hypothetical protein
MGYFSAGLFMSFQYVEHLLGASDEAVEGHRQFSIEDDVFLHRDPCRSGRLQYQREITEQVRNTAVNTDGRTTREFRGGIRELRNSGGNFVALPRDSCRPARPYLRPILVRLNVLSTLLGGTDITRWWRTSPRDLDFSKNFAAAALELVRDPSECARTHQDFSFLPEAAPSHGLSRSGSSGGRTIAKARPQRSQMARICGHDCISGR